MVVAAREASTFESREALETLCRTYWYPVYAFVRRQGFDAEDARDLTQAYFASLLEKEYLDDYEPSRGRFRVFLRTSVRHFLSKERDKRMAVRRGGETQILSLDTSDVEGRYSLEPADRSTPEEMFERRWTLTILERVLDQLRREQAEAGLRVQFERLQGFLTGEETETSYRDMAAELRTSEGAIKMAIHRLRQRFGQLLRGEIAETVSSPDQVDDEVKHLLGVIAPWRHPPSD